jgi:hypothetical protein
VDRRNHVNRFDFHDHGVFHDEIRAEAHVQALPRVDTGIAF